MVIHSFIQLSTLLGFNSIEKILAEPTGELNQPDFSKAFGDVSKWLSNNLSFLPNCVLK